MKYGTRECFNHLRLLSCLGRVEKEAGGGGGGGGGETDLLKQFGMLPISAGVVGDRARLFGVARAFVAISETGVLFGMEWCGSYTEHSPVSGAPLVLISCQYGMRVRHFTCARASSTADSLTVTGRKGGEVPTAL